MKYGAFFGWGIAIYAVMFLAWSALALYGLTAGIFPRVLLLMVLVATAFIAGRSLRKRSPLDVLPYSIAWVVVVALFDALLAVPMAGWQLYLDWNVWVGYGLVAAVPLLAPFVNVRVRSDSPV